MTPKKEEAMNHLQEDDFIYRKAEENDIDEVFALFQKAIAEMDRNGIPQWDELYPDREILLEDITKGTMTLLTKGNRIAALCSKSEEYDEGYKNGHWKYPDAKFCVLHRLCVNPEFQNQGLARMMVLHMEKECRKLGYETIRFDSFPKNPFAVKLYNSLGYEVVGSVEFRKGTFDLREKVL